MWWKLLLLFFIGYFIGGINFSIIISKLVGGFDIRTKGSGNAGGTNVARTLGAGWGILTIAMEILKSSGVALFVRHVYPAGLEGMGEIGAILCGLVTVTGCVLGNTFPCYYRFKGGKGVTVAAAAAIVVDWRLFALLLALFIVIFLITRYVSVGSLISALLIPVGTVVLLWGQEHAVWAFAMTFFVTGMVFYNHRANIVRLFKGTENRFDFSKKGK